MGATRRGGGSGRFSSRWEEVGAGETGAGGGARAGGPSPASQVRLGGEAAAVAALLGSAGGDGSGSGAAAGWPAPAGGRPTAAAEAATGWSTAAAEVAAASDPALARFLSPPRVPRHLRDPERIAAKDRAAVRQEYFVGKVPLSPAWGERRRRLEAAVEAEQDAEHAALALALLEAAEVTLGDEGSEEEGDDDGDDPGARATGRAGGRAPPLGGSGLHGLEAIRLGREQGDEGGGSSAWFLRPSVPGRRFLAGDLAPGARVTLLTRGDLVEAARILGVPLDEAEHEYASLWDSSLYPREGGEGEGEGARGGARGGASLDASPGAPYAASPSPLRPGARDGDAVFSANQRDGEWSVPGVPGRAATTPMALRSAEARARLGGEAFVGAAMAPEGFADDPRVPVGGEQLAGSYEVDKFTTGYNWLYDGTYARQVIARYGAAAFPHLFRALDGGLPRRDAERLEAARAAPGEGPGEGERGGAPGADSAVGGFMGEAVRDAVPPPESPDDSDFELGMTPATPYYTPGISDPAYRSRLAVVQERMLRAAGPRKQAEAMALKKWADEDETLEARRRHGVGSEPGDFLVGRLRAVRATVVRVVHPPGGRRTGQDAGARARARAPTPERSAAASRRAERDLALAPDGGILVRLGPVADRLLTAAVRREPGFGDFRSGPDDEGSEGGVGSDEAGSTGKGASGPAGDGPEATAGPRRALTPPLSLLRDGGVAPTATRMLDALARTEVHAARHDGEDNVRRALFGADVERAALTPPPWTLHPDWGRAVRAGLTCSPGEALDARQRRAVWASLHRTLTLWRGPPGCGKTRAIAFLVRVLLRAGVPARLGYGEFPGAVLLTADTNAGADNLAEAVVDACAARVVRVGDPARVRDRLRPHTLRALASRSPEGRLAEEADELARRAAGRAARIAGTGERRYALRRREFLAEAQRERARADSLRRSGEDRVLDEAQVIVSTCAGVLGAELNGRRFPFVVVDEVGQSTEPSALIPALQGAQAVVLVGDPRQLPPTVLTEEAENLGLSETLFSRLVEWGLPPLDLTTQYRMHPEVADFPTREFYGGLVSHGVSDASRPPVPGLPGRVVFVEIRGGSQSSLASRGQARGVGEEGRRAPLGAGSAADGGGLGGALPSFAFSYRNAEEAAAVAATARRLAALNPPGCIDGIAVLTPYAAQRSLLQRLLADLLESRRDVAVSTIDGFQGREADAVLLSTVRTRGVGFVGDPARVNVALTRARRAIAVFGRADALGGDPTWRRWLGRADALGSEGGPAGEEGGTERKGPEGEREAAKTPPRRRGPSRGASRAGPAELGSDVADEALEAADRVARARRRLREARGAPRGADGAEASSAGPPQDSAAEIGEHLVSALEEDEAIASGAPISPSQWEDEDWFEGEAGEPRGWLRRQRSGGVDDGSEGEEGTLAASGGAGRGA